MKKYLMVSMLVAVGISGCSFEVTMNEKNETEMGSHRVVVKPGSSFTSSSSSSGGDSEVYRYSCGEVTIDITNDELVVNKVRYGQLAPGADILVDHDVVFVGGEERQGVPMTAQEVMEAAPVKETTRELNGYTITVRPGSSVTSKTQLFGKYTLTVGETKVSIKNNELSVNDVSFGSLAKGNTVVVEPGSVNVSGEMRTPED